MKKLEHHIENAFDLSYTQFPLCPDTKIRRIGVLGGGTAGYLAALALKKFHPQIETQVVESSKIPVIGVGESTTTEIVAFLHRFLEIDPADFIREVEPTLKFGIRFDWGNPEDSHFNFNFFASHPYESQYYENNILNSNWPSVLMTEGKVPVVRQKDGSLLSFLGSIPFSYHIDNKNLIRFLRKTVKSRGIEILDAEVSTVHLDETGFVESLDTVEGHHLKYDLYVDCSGFRSKILGQALQTPFIPFASTLITDRAMTFDLPNHGVINPYTRVNTMDNGWCWTIPMRGENHHGYVHSSKYCDEATALAEVRAKYGPVENYKMVQFRSGRHEKAWNKNVFALGNAYAFIEPLESTAIQTASHSIMSLCRLMPNSLQDETSIRGLNEEIAATWDTFRWFLGMHYKYNQKLKTPFWDWCRENTDIGNARHIIDLYRQRAPLSASQFGTGSPFIAWDALIFNSNSYDTLLFGQKVLPNEMKTPTMTKEDYFSKVESYKELTKNSLSLAELFAGDHLFKDELLSDLFSDADTWIQETDV